LFALLPKPKNDFEIIVADVDVEEDSGKSGIEDAEDVKKRLEAEKMAEEERRLQQRSQAVQLDLPRPVVSLTTLQAMYSDADSVEGLINREKAMLLYRDSVEYPVAGQEEFDFESNDPVDHLLDAANALIQSELEKMEIEDLHFPQLFVDYQMDLGNKTYPDEFTQEHLISCHESMRNQMKQQASKSQKLEKKLNITLGGYMIRKKNLIQRLHQLSLELEEKRNDLDLFGRIRELEVSISEVRIAKERKELERLAMMEQDLQDHYRQLRYQQDELSR
jgi:pre-mRNA-splicing factor CDC5/CEF1